MTTADDGFPLAGLFLSRQRRWLRMCRAVLMWWWWVVLVLVTAVCPVSSVLTRLDILVLRVAWCPRLSVRSDETIRWTVAILL